MESDFSLEVGYSIATGKTYAPFGEIHKAVEELLGRSVWTHEFVQKSLWDQIRLRFEERATEKYNEWQRENSN